MSGILLAVLWLAIGIVGFTTASALLGLPVMKLSAPTLPWKKHAVIAWSSFFRGYMVMFAVYAFYIFGLGRDSSSVPALAVIAALLLSGWLISTDLKEEGVSISFPGVGARVIIALIITSWALVGLVAVLGPP